MSSIMSIHTCMSCFLRNEWVIYISLRWDLIDKYHPSISPDGYYSHIKPSLHALAQGFSTICFVCIFASHRGPSIFQKPAFEGQIHLSILTLYLKRFGWPNRNGLWAARTWSTCCEQKETYIHWPRTALSYTHVCMFKSISYLS